MNALGSCPSSGLPRIWACPCGSSDLLSEIRAALEHGVDGIALDVRRRSGGILVVSHGETLNSCRATPSHREVRITPVEVMDAFPETPLLVNLAEDGTEEELAAVLRETRRRDVIVVSSSERRLRRFRTAAPGIPTGAGLAFLLRFWLLSRVLIAARPSAGMAALVVPNRLVGLPFCDRRLLVAARRRHLQVHVESVEGEEDVARLAVLGADGILTHRPSFLCRLLGVAGSGVSTPPEALDILSPAASATSPRPNAVVNELRIHGVGGSPGPRLLGVDDPSMAPVDAELSKGAITVRRRRDEHGALVGFDWGDLTSGAKVQALWVFLLPFTLLNVAGWAHTSAGARMGSFWRTATRVLVVSAGWLLTATWVLWIANLIVAYAAYQWVPRISGNVSRVVPMLPFGWWHLTLTPLALRRAAIIAGGLIVLALIVLAAVVAGRARKEVEEPAPGRSPSFRREDGPFGREFFAKRPSCTATLPVHVGIAVVVVGLVVVQAWVATGRTPRPGVAPVDVTIAVVAGMNFAVLVALILFSWILPWLASLGKPISPGHRRPNGTAASAAVMATALTNAFFSGAVLWVANYLGAHPKRAGTLRTGIDLVLLDAYFLLAVLWGVIGIALWMFKRPIAHFLERERQPSEVPPGWEKRVRGAEASATIMRRADLVLIAAATVFVLVGFGFGAKRVDPQGWQLWEWDVAPVSPTGWPYATAAWALPLAVAFAMVRVRKAATDNRLRRFFGQAWDVLSFWPRRHHPFAVRPYSHVAVPVLRDQILRLTGGGDRLLVSAHSQGSILALCALATLSSDARTRTALVTYGSHAAGLYRRGFPEYFDAAEVVGVAPGLGKAPRPRWHNFYRLTDPIGGPIFSNAPEGAKGYDYCLPDPAVEPQRPPEADRAPPLERDREPFTALAVHSYYLNEQRLKAVVEALKDDLAGPDGTPNRRSSNPSRRHGAHRG